MMMMIESLKKNILFHDLEEADRRNVHLVLEVNDKCRIKPKIKRGYNKRSYIDEAM